MAVYYDEILAGNCFGQINVTPPPRPNGAVIVDKKQSLPLSDEFGLSIEELFHIGRQFLKENKEIQLKYDDNIRLIALSKQIKIGKWEASYTQDVGFLDVVGNDRKQAWIALGDMSKETAMEEYVKILLNRYTIFRTYLENQHMENEEKDRLRQDNETRHTLEQEAERVRQYEFEQVSKLEKQKKKREDFQRKQIQDTLNQQTYLQFKAYAEQQYRDNRQAQEELIRQLQEQHFQQYMQQVYQQQLIDQQQQQLKIKTNMEQQQQPPTENVGSTELQSLPTSINIIPFVPNIPIQSIPQMPPLCSAPAQLPPLGPAPAQLPPLVHPPIPTSQFPPLVYPPVPIPQSVVNTNAINQEQVIPIQTQFETLSLNTPLEPIPQQSVGNDSQFSSELNTTQELVAGNPIDPDAAVNPTGEASLVGEEGKPELPNITPANMWTRKDIKEFKDQIRKEKDAVIKIGSGETVTVRVPTHEDGQCIFWEFATDYYDLGFGLYFEWSKAPSNTVTVHVSDSSDEEEENENGEKKDIEKGSGSTNKPPKPPQDEIVPIYRRDSHEEVYAGSHPYPGNGVYLLKFDNSYSLWRSKTLYYRVYYSK